MANACLPASKLSRWEDWYVYSSLLYRPIVMSTFAYLNLTMIRAGFSFVQLFQRGYNRWGSHKWPHLKSFLPPSCIHHKLAILIIIIHLKLETVDWIARSKSKMADTRLPASKLSLWEDWYVYSSLLYAPTVISTFAYPNWTMIPACSDSRRPTAY